MQIEMKLPPHILNTSFIFISSSTLLLLTHLSCCVCADLPPPVLGLFLAGCRGQSAFGVFFYDEAVETETLVVCEAHGKRRQRIRKQLQSERHPVVTLSSCGA
ncbi:unnamed protein product [Pleuronectes platessa]|uniref:Secreted protein n=1 Tax=Pleuronectes platessa TaxID=8262 RepID=A0A9N7UD91_PLEPL|nr:unnamed protein product [Pleuronectes platessa]